MRDRNEPDLFKQSMRQIADSENVAYLGDPNVIKSLICDTIDKVMYTQSQPDVSDEIKMKVTQRECAKLGSILLGSSQKADFSPIPNWNQPGRIDGFCAKWCGSSETKPAARMEHAVMKMIGEIMTLGEYVGEASEEESKWQFDAIVQMYTGIFMGISPPMQAVG